MPYALSSGAFKTSIFFRCQTNMAQNSRGAGDVTDGPGCPLKVILREIPIGKDLAFVWILPF